MTFVGCSIPEQFVNPLFEVFDGGDFALSSYRDVEAPLAQMRIYMSDPSDAGEAERCLQCDLRFTITGHRLWSDYTADKEASK